MKDSNASAFLRVQFLRIPFSCMLFNWMHCSWYYWCVTTMVDQNVRSLMSKHPLSSYIVRRSLSEPMQADVPRSGAFGSVHVLGVAPEWSCILCFSCTHISMFLHLRKPQREQTCLFKGMFLCYCITPPQKANNLFACCCITAPCTICASL